MSSLYVRQEISQWLQGYGALPFYNTVNEAEHPSEPQWFTVTFDADFSERVNFCGVQRESGTLTLDCFGRAGGGYEDLLAAVEPLLDYVHQYSDSSGKLTLADSHIINDAPWLEAHRWYGISAEIDYTLYD